jgi:L-lactate dehydrogenase
MKGKKQMSKKITILGVGNVGSTVAYTLSLKSMASEIVLIDINRAKAEGEAMDIIHGAPFSTPLNIYAGDYSDASGSDLVIVTSGLGRKPGQSRLELASINVELIKEIAPKIASYCPNAVYIIVSNPVDILTYAFIQYSKLPANQIVGSGTMLDTSRLRALVSKRLQVSAKNIHAYVFGEHGDSSTFPWSITSVIGMDFRQYCRSIHHYTDEQTDAFLRGVEKDVRDAGAEIIKRKGATYYAVSTCVASMASAMFSNNESVLTASTLAHHRYGIKEDVCLSLPCVLGANGIVREVDPPLTEQELADVQNSARVLRNTLDSIGL